MAQLNLFVFGPPHLQQDGAAVNLSRRKVIGLLVYLAVTGQMHHRDALTALLWPEYEAGKGRSYLCRLISDQLDVAQFLTCLNQGQGHDHPAAAICTDCLLHSQGRDEGYRQQLAELYAQFTEGFATGDLRVVQTMLQEVG